MSQQTQAQEVTSHFPVARLVTIGHFQSAQSLVVVAQWEEHALRILFLNSASGIHFSLGRISQSNYVIQGVIGKSMFKWISKLDFQSTVVHRLTSISIFSGFQSVKYV